jgi:hypothetical protein
LEAFFKGDYEVMDIHTVVCPMSDIIALLCVGANLEGEIFQISESKSPKRAREPALNVEGSGIDRPVELGTGPTNTVANEGPPSSKGGGKKTEESTNATRCLRPGDLIQGRWAEGWKLQDRVSIAWFARESAS